MNSGCILKVEQIKSPDRLDVGVGEREWGDNQGFGLEAWKPEEERYQQEAATSKEGWCEVAGFLARKTKEQTFFLQSAGLHRLGMV